MERVQKSIEVDRPIRMVYDQWTQFETFPEFMKGVEKVQQLDDKRLHWQADIGFAEREFDAEIIQQVPDQVIAWRATGETAHMGQVSFREVGPQRTEVSLLMEWEPSGLVEKAGDALGVVDSRVEGDLKRFKEFIESRSTETGAWRGEIHGASAAGQTAPSGTTGTGTGTAGV